MRRAPWTFIVFCLLAAFASAQTVEIALSTGFEGVILRNGLWPLTVRVTNGAEESIGLKVTVASDRIGRQSLASVVKTLVLSRGATKSFTLLIGGSDMWGRSIAVESSRPVSMFLHGRGVEERRTAPTRALEAPFTDRTAQSIRDVESVALAIGQRAHQLATAIDAGVAGKVGQRLSFDGEVGLVAECAMRDLPDTSLAYAGVKTLFWTEPDFQAFADPSQWRAIRTWVEAGGRLVILAAARRELLDQPEWAALLPAVTSGVARAAYPGGRGAAFQGPVLKASPKDGAQSRRAEDGDAASPVTRIERRVGAGVVVLATIDPLVYDTGDAEVLLEGLRYASGAEMRFSGDGSQSQYGWYGGFDFGGEVFRGMLLNRNILEPSGPLLFLIGILFVLVIGPIDYAMLKGRKKLQWSPVTLLVYTAAFSIACIVATFYIFAPKPETNRVAVVDCHVGADGVERGTGLLFQGFYAPFGKTVKMGPDGDFDFYAKPFTTLDAVTSPNAEQECVGPGKQAIDAELTFNSFRAYETYLRGPIDGGLDFAVTDRGGGKFHVSVRNRFARPLQGVVVSDGMVYLALGDLASGAQIERDLDTASASTVASLSSEIFQVQDPATGDWERLANRDDGGIFGVKRGGAEKPSDRDLKFFALIAISPGSGDRTPDYGYRSFNVPALKTPGLARDRFVVAGVMQALPFKERSDGDAPGFTYTLVRRTSDVEKAR